MSDNTRIDYLDATWNPVAMRCTRVSAGCANCWHLPMAARHAANPNLSQAVREARGGGAPVLVEKELEKPLHWKRPRRIGAMFMGDLFHEKVPFEFIWKVLGITQKARQHQYLILTKRPERMLEVVKTANPPANVWLGVSVENQQAADERIPLLLQCPAAVRFLSIEPLLGPVDLDAVPVTAAPGFFGSPLRWHHRGECHKREGIPYPTLDWVIVGGESGPKARPMDEDWVRSIRDQCVSAGVPMFYKQRIANGQKISMPVLDGKVWAQVPEVQS